MALLDINLDAEQIAPPVVDNILINHLPVEPVAQTAAAELGSGLPQTSGAPITIKIAYETARTYTLMIDMILGEIGHYLGGGDKSRYKLGQTELEDFSTSFGKMLFYNNMAAANPNILFFLTSVVVFAPKVRNILADRKTRLAQKMETPSANVPRGTVEKSSTSVDAPPQTFTQNIAPAANVPRGTNIENLVNSYRLPNDKAEALKISEVKYGRANFLIAAEENTPNKNLYYHTDLHNKRIKNGTHDRVVGATPSEYFKTFFLECEKLGFPAELTNKASKMLRQKITKKLKISSADINENLAKDLN